MCLEVCRGGRQQGPVCTWGVSSQGAWYYLWLPHSVALRYWPCCIIYEHVGFPLEMPKSLTPRTWVSIHQLLWNRCVNRFFTHLLSIGIAPCLFFCSLLLPSVFLEECGTFLTGEDSIWMAESPARPSRMISLACPISIFHSTQVLRIQI